MEGDNSSTGNCGLPTLTSNRGGLLDDCSLQNALRKPGESTMSDDDKDMGITPRLTVAAYKNALNLVALPDGREQHPPLPELTTNAKQGMLDVTKLCQECQESPYLDTDAYKKNTKLAEAISEALNKIRPPDKDGAHFVLAWRL